MAKSITPTDILVKSSKGYITDYYTTSTPTSSAVSIQPTVNLLELKNLFSDHTFNYLVTKIVNSCLINRYKVVSVEDSSKRDLSKESKLRELGYDAIERSIFLNLVVYRMAFIENGKKKLADEGITQLYLLEAPDMQISVDEHGEVLGYKQVPLNNTKGIYVDFNPEQVTHLKFNELSTNPYGFVDTKAIAHLVYYKNFIEEYMNNLFKNNKFRDFFTVEEGTAPSVKIFMDNIRESDRQSDKSLVGVGKIGHSTLRQMSELDYLIKVLQKYEESISRFLLVPPLMGGDVGGSSRSTGEFEVRYDYGTTIRTWQQTVADQVSRKLFPLIGFDGYMLQYNNFDKIDHEKTLRIAAQLQGIGYKPEDIHHYLMQNGIELPSTAMPEDPMEKQAEMANEQARQNQNAPSRAPQRNVGTMKAGSESSTRDSQVKTKSSSYETKWGRYPYVY
jgi:hypothetical protein